MQLVAPLASDFASQLGHDDNDLLLSPANQQDPVAALDWALTQDDEQQLSFDTGFPDFSTSAVGPIFSLDSTASQPSPDISPLTRQNTTFSKSSSNLLPQLSPSISPQFDKLSNDATTRSTMIIPDYGTAVFEEPSAATQGYDFINGASFGGFSASTVNAQQASIPVLAMPPPNVTSPPITPLPLEQQNAPIPMPVSANSHPITAQQQQQINRQTEDILNESYVVFLLAPTGEIRCVSSTSESLLGRHPLSHVGATFLQYLYQDDINK